MSHTTLISVADLRAHLADPGWVVLDCRFDLADPDAGRRRHAQGHIPGARYVDLNRELSAPVTAHSGRHPLPDPRDFARTAGGWGIGQGSQIVVYDETNAGFAARAWWMLRWIGLRTVAVLDGGFAAWHSDNGAIETTAPRRGLTTPAHDLPARVHADWVLSSAQIEAWRRDPANLLIDARAAARFAGITEPIDAVAGHVPGAINRPFSANLGPDGRLLPARQLREQWLGALGGTDPARIACMCGSGVTACQNLLALEVAGLPGAKLYAGSWSEWIRDPSRPVARQSFT
ncbi:MAG: sulfurtransferase [Proteobacteria bacterium]|nr:sulfurtransferase [Pseudomonadota bacterium]